jgi:hypothetical protein
MNKKFRKEHSAWRIAKSGFTLCALRFALGGFVKGETHGTDGNPDLQIVTQNKL